MPIAHVNGTRLNYVQMEAEDGAEREDLVMVHGLATSLAFWYLRYAPEFSQRFRVTLFDLRGHGRSEMTASGYTPHNLALDLQGLLDHLGIRRAHVLAHSFGGVVAMNLACIAPERIASLALADTHICAAREHRHGQWPQAPQLQAIIDRHGLKLDANDPYFGYRLLTEVAHLQLKDAPVPEELQQLVGPLLAKAGRRTAEQWIRLMDSTRAEAEMMGDDGLSLERLRRFGFPVMAMYGDHSQARLTGRELLDVWPHAEFRRVRDAGHFFPTSRPDEVIRCCQRFWRGDLGQRPRQREGEVRGTHFRSDRLHQENGAWYCYTREHARIGPCASIDDARHQLAHYLSSLQIAA